MGLLLLFNLFPVLKDDDSPDTCALVDLAQQEDLEIRQIPA